jgi:hypothetical protein
MVMREPVKNLLFLLFALAPRLLPAQLSPIPLHSTSGRMLERLSVLYPETAPIHPEIKPYARQDAARWATALDTSRRAARARQEIDYLLRDHLEYAEPAGGGKQPVHFWGVNNRDLILRIRPMFQGALGRSNRAGFLFLNQRGLDVQGVLDDRLYFHTSLVESQWQPPAYVADYIEKRRAVPGTGFYKTYRSRFFRVDKGYDFNVANAGIGVQATRRLGVELGHGVHFFGNGVRSLFLADFGSNYFYLKLNARVWRLHYQCLWMELSPVSQKMVHGNSLLPKKYAAIHYLNVKATPRLAFGFFEATIFNRSRQFELQYLNPVILYRSVEGLIGSPDNVLIGLDGRWDLFRRFRLYGQLIVDEFLLRALTDRARRGWWGNKFGIQGGLKYLNAFGIARLDLQAERNLVRPYTYSHFDSLNAYMHYNQALAHPLGSNFKETILTVRYNPVKHVLLQARLVRMRVGENDGRLNWGADPGWSNATRAQEYANRIGQGRKVISHLAGLDAGWQFRHNLWLDVRYVWRHRQPESAAAQEQEVLWLGGIRWNFWPAPLDI